MAYERLKAASDAVKASSDALTAQAAELAAAVADVMATPTPTPEPTPTPTPTPPPTPTPTPTVKRWFNDKAIFNTLIPAGAAKHPQSDYWMSLQRGIKPRGVDFQLNLGMWTPTVLYATSTTPRRQFRNSDGWTLDNVPYDPKWHGSNDSDSQAVIIDSANNCLYCFGFESFNANGTTRTFEGGYGKFHIDGPGIFDPTQGGPWGGGRSSNFASAACLVRPEELKAGVIEHAIGCCCDGNIQGPDPILPALSTDNWGPILQGGFPNGARMQFDPTVNLDTLGLGKEAKIIVRAMQRYGMFSIERGSGLAIYFQNSTTSSADPYAGMDFRGLTGTLLTQMRVLQGERSYAYETGNSWTPPQPHLT
jgi:hypothetical protein